MATPKRQRRSSGADGECGESIDAEAEWKRSRRRSGASGSSHGHSERESSASSSSSVEQISTSAFVYKLDVIQQPRRARACGFGDKDHRPLSPIPIIRLRVYRRNGTEVDADDVDTSSLVLCLDLWSADGLVERNVVRHPASAVSHRRQSPAPEQTPDSSPAMSQLGLASNDRSATATANSSPRFPHTNLQHGGTPDALTAGQPITTDLRSFPSQQPSPLPFPFKTEWNPASHHARDVRPVTAPSSFERTAESPMLPSIAQLSGSQLGRRSSSLADSDFFHLPTNPSTLSPIHSSPRTHSSHSTATTSSLTLTDYSFGQRLPSSRPLSSGSTHSSWLLDSRPVSASVPGPSGWGPAIAPSLSFPEKSSSSSSRPSSGYFAAKPKPASISRPLPLPPAPPPSSQAGIPVLTRIPSSESSESSDSSAELEPVDHGSYSRVLVGLLGEMCCKLQGIDGDVGLFFFPKSLGVRTEGSFALKCTLVQFEPEPPPGNPDAKTSQVLAQCQTEAFEVYPAKRFPGVCPLTDMTRHFAKQGIRLPMRRKTLDGDEEDEDDADNP